MDPTPFIELDGDGISATLSTVARILSKCSASCALAVMDKAETQRDIVQLEREGVEFFFSC
jgi:hypothetical protein